MHRTRRTFTRRAGAGAIVLIAAAALVVVPGSVASADTLPTGAQWLDFWIICDTVNCHMYSSDDNGQMYRAQTTVANFPNRFSTPVIAMQESNKFWLFEGANVYRLGAANEYLLLVEAIGEGRRMFSILDRSERLWTLDPAGRHEGKPVRPPQQRHPRRQRLDERLQPRGNDPQRHRPEPGHQPLQSAVPVPGHEPQLDRPIQSSALAAGPAEADQLTLLTPTHRAAGFATTS